MSKVTESASSVRFQGDAIRIGQQSRLLLCASLFYFRIPRAYWRARMEQLKHLGYNTIDVYFPWNHHEQQEGVWDFEGERDVEAFLRTAAETGLWVVARPGPYICSEWDGGALPAYLLAREGMRLRDNDPQFLQCVAGWFDRILPLLRAFQEGEGGSVIAVQLDNELDFYNCSDPKGYIGALRDMALARGITVPLFACAGQGGLAEATGWAEGVAPACNVYADDRAPELEAKVLHYERLVRERGYPLLVTETNRSHYFLRRLLACGAKLLGPYLQVSGTDFGFTNATNNWGSPLAFLTSDYDFGGMISPEGEIREEGYEGRLLGRLIQTYGEALGEATVCTLEEAGWRLEGGNVGVARPQALRLRGGGYLATVTNLEDRDKRLVLCRIAGEAGTGQPRIAFTLPASRSMTLPLALPTSRFGVSGGCLESAGAELYLSADTDDGQALLFHAEGAASLALQLEEPLRWEARGAAVAYLDGRLIVEADGAEEMRCRIWLAAGGVLQLIVHSLDKALYVESIANTGDVVMGARPTPRPPGQPVTEGWTMSAVDASAPIPGVDGPIRLTRADYLERVGIYRGYAWYEARLPSPQRQVAGVLIRQGSDVVSLYADGGYVGTAVPGGSDAYLAFGEPREADRLQARVEIWGHSNFDDVLQPSLGLHAMKGLTGLTAVSQVHRLSGNWQMLRGPYLDSLALPVDAAVGDAWPMVSFGDWTSPDQPALECYRRTFTATADADSWTLHFPELRVRARLYVDDLDMGEISPFDPYIRLDDLLAPGQTMALTVVMERARGLPRGPVLLYEGVRADEWSVCGADEATWHGHAERGRSEAVAVALPLELVPGDAAWLHLTTDESPGGLGWRVAVAGAGLKLTAFYAGRIVGRLWLAEEGTGPTMRGGDPASFYLPGAWREAAGGQLSLLLEAIDAGALGRLSTVRFRAVTN